MLVILCACHVVSYLIFIGQPNRQSLFCHDCSSRYIIILYLTSLRLMYGFSFNTTFRAVGYSFGIWYLKTLETSAPPAPTVANVVVRSCSSSTVVLRRKLKALLPLHQHISHSHSPVYHIGPDARCDVSNPDTPMFIISFSRPTHAM